MAQPMKRSEANVAVDVAAVGPGPYRINVAAALSGIPAATLRAWERRYGVPVPRRTTSAYRLYSSEDVDLVRRMRELVESGVAPAEAARTLLAASASLTTSEEPAGIDTLELVRERIMAATQRWDARAIDEELMRVLFLVDAQTLYSKVVSPLLVEVGARWGSGQLSVAQEHLLSEKLELALRAVLRTLDRTDGPSVLLGTISGDTHVLGLLGAAIKLAQGGAKLAMLGASTPPSAIADAVRSMAPRLVGLSATETPVRDARPLFKAYAKACGTTPWVVGGTAAEAVAELITEAGGIVAVGPMSAWGPQVREWLRGAR
jgi:DNA-binding transcriptional MerR regulator